MPRKTETLNDVIERVEWQIKVKKAWLDGIKGGYHVTDAPTVTVTITDVERIIHAAIGGDDAA